MPTKTAHPLRQREEATKGVRAQVAAKRKPAKAKPTAAAKKPTHRQDRLTQAWPSKKGREVRKGDTVKLANGLVGTVLGRWSKRVAGKIVPYVTVDITGGVPAKGDFALSTKTGVPRATSPAAEVVHTKPAS